MRWSKAGASDLTRGARRCNGVQPAGRPQPEGGWMYSFEPSEEQKLLMETVRKFAAKDLRPAARDADEAAELPRAVVERGWELGLLQASIPEQYGGFGERSALTGVLGAEELAWGDLAGALAVMAPALF